MIVVHEAELAKLGEGMTVDSPARLVWRLQNLFLSHLSDERGRKMLGINIRPSSDVPETSCIWALRTKAS